ncbi:MAG: hypothetical protein KGO02_17250 [Alphaproteobacteria bacterium]|nr:hypothetical protein [Alphaproteobacteria bacterium]
MKKKKEMPQPFAAATKDQRYAGTYEVLVPVEGRVRPLRAAQNFPTLKAAEDWIHSADGAETIARLVAENAA